jgi:hypothetical protein
VLGRISRIKVHGADVTFEHERRELESLRRELPNISIDIPEHIDRSFPKRLTQERAVSDPIEPLPPSEIQERPVDQMLVLSDRARVDEAWHRVELSLRTLVRQAGLPSSRSVKGLVDTLRQSGILDTTVLDVADRLRVSHNIITRARGPLESGVAAAFAQAADKLQLVLQNQSIAIGAGTRVSKLRFRFKAAPLLG